MTVQTQEYFLLNRKVQNLQDGFKLTGVGKMAVEQCSDPHSHSQTQSDESLRSSTHDLQGHFGDLNPEAEGKEYGVSNLQFFMQLCNSL